MAGSSEITHYKSLEEIGQIISPLNAVRSGKKRFTRYVSFVPPGFSLLQLGELLHIADEQLDIASELCGSQTVPHEWGIVPAHPTAPHLARVARGILVTTVDTIYSESGTTYNSMPGDIDTQLRNGVARYRELFSKQKYGLSDIHERQFMYGYNINMPHDKPSLYLVDPDPRFRDEPFFTARELIPRIADIIH